MYGGNVCLAWCTKQHALELFFRCQSTCALIFQMATTCGWNARNYAACVPASKSEAPVTQRWQRPALLIQGVRLEKIQIFALISLQIFASYQPSEPASENNVNICVEHAKRVSLQSLLLQTLHRMQGPPTQQPTLALEALLIIFSKLTPVTGLHSRTSRCLRSLAIERVPAKCMHWAPP